MSAQLQTMEKTKTTTRNQARPPVPIRSHNPPLQKVNGKLPKSDHSDPLKPKSDHFETWSNLIGPLNLAQYDWLLYRVTSFWASWPNWPNMIGSYIERRHFGPDWAQRFVLLGPGNLGQLTSRVNGTSGFLHVKYLDQFFEVTLNIWPNIKNGRNERLFATF